MHAGLPRNFSNPLTKIRICKPQRVCIEKRLTYPVNRFFNIDPLLDRVNRLGNRCVTG